MVGFCHGGNVPEGHDGVGGDDNRLLLVVAMTMVVVVSANLLK